MNRILVVIGIQKGHEEGAEKFVKKTIDWINAHAHNYDQVISSIRINTKVDNFERYMKDYSMEDTDVLGYHTDKILTREGYTLPEGFPIPNPNTHFDVIGMNTHSSVMGHVLDMFGKGYDFSVLSELTTCQEGKKVQEAALTVLKEAIGNALK